MIVSDLLSELRENILHDRSDQVAGVTDQLWSNATLMRYINEAHERFAKRSECLRDFSTPNVVVVSLIVGQEFYTLHPKIMGILSARYMGNSTLPADIVDIARAGHANLDTYTTVDNRYFDTSSISVLKPGKVVAFTTDEGMTADGRGALNSMVLRTFPIVGAGYDGTLNLRVVRLPLRKLVLTDPNATPEIPEQYHLNMLDWAGYLALRQPDLDVAGGDGFKQANALAVSFENHVNDAKREIRRRMFAPPAFRFGQNGFTYERDWSA